MRVLITGGAGSVGKMLAKSLDHEIVLFDKDDHQLWEAKHLFPEVQTVLGDVRTTEDLRHWVKWADLVIHAAAYKNIEITELNPLATTDNDFRGTACVVHECMKHDNKKMILVSTDKAVYPVSVLGASKLLAEKLVLSHGFTVARFVNVEETRGNVFDLWRKEHRAGLPLSLTDERMERHFNTEAGVVSLFKYIIDTFEGGEVFIPNVPKLKVIDKMRSIYGDCEYNIVGIRKNEKLYDPLMTEEETGRSDLVSNFIIIK